MHSPSRSPHVDLWCRVRCIAVVGNWRIIRGSNPARFAPTNRADSGAPVGRISGVGVGDGVSLQLSRGITGRYTQLD